MAQFENNPIIIIGFPAHIISINRCKYKTISRKEKETASFGTYLLSAQENSADCRVVNLHTSWNVLCALNL